jgi:predicted transcriptional regulator of viral defense system
MTYLLFREIFHDLGVFSIRDIVKLFPDFDSRRLVEWQRKGYIQKLINKWYLFADLPMNDNLRYRISNCLYRPSYISLESALSHYNLIPEGVFSLFNITTRKTIVYDTAVGSFHYRTLKPSLFFGYSAERDHAIPILLASPEKAILDYFYLNSHLNRVEDIEGLRLDITAIKSIVDWDKLEKYAACFESAVLNKRVRMLKKLSDHADIS